jgi:hypothetical protein
MPTNRTSGSGTGRARGAGTRTGTAAGTGPWNPVHDALHSVMTKFRDPVALEGLRAMDTAGDVIEMLGVALKTVGAEAASSIEFGAAAAYFEELGAYVLRAAQPTRDGAAAVNRIVAEKRRIAEEGTSKDEAWDVGKNRGV